VVDLPNNQVAVDVRQTPTGVVVDFLKTGVPEALRRRLDVGDFGTPVAQVTTVPQGENTRLTIEARGLWEQTVYQSDTQLVVDVKPIKEDPNKLTQGSQAIVARSCRSISRTSKCARRCRRLPISPASTSSPATASAAT
jgi:type IV pilus assembly protein PilQ